MSLSKISTNSDSFVPQQILNRQNQDEGMFKDILLTDNDHHFTPADDTDQHQEKKHSTDVSQNSINDNLTDEQLPVEETESPQLADTPESLTPEEQSHQIPAEQPPPPPDNAPVDVPDEEQEAPVQQPVDLEQQITEAYTNGLRNGRKNAADDYGTSVTTLLHTCQQLDQLRETILKNSSADILSLVMHICEKIIHQSVSSQKDTIITTITEAIQMAVKCDEFQILVHPDDLQAVQDNTDMIMSSISSLENIIIRADSSIQPGGCKLDSPSCSVDATIATQLTAFRDFLGNATG